MPYSSSPWFLRGGYSNASIAGVFSFNGNGGNVYCYGSFRFACSLEQ
jgi:hypothetical protein